MLCNEQIFLRPIHQIPLNISFGSNKKELLITGYAYISRNSAVAGRHKITWRRRAFRLSTRLPGMYTRRATYVDFWYKSTSRPGRAIFPAIYCLYVWNALVHILFSVFTVKSNHGKFDLRFFAVHSPMKILCTAKGTKSEFSNAASQ